MNANWQRINGWIDSRGNHIAVSADSWRMVNKSETKVYWIFQLIRITIFMLNYDTINL
jgi:hypothetical protein